MIQKVMAAEQKVSIASDANASGAAEAKASALRVSETIH
jgi:hypothetical protein